MYNLSYDLQIFYEKRAEGPYSTIKECDDIINV